MPRLRQRHMYHGKICDEGVTAKHARGGIHLPQLLLHHLVSEPRVVGAQREVNVHLPPTLGVTVEVDAENGGLVGAVCVHKFHHHVAAAGSSDDADVATVTVGYSCCNGEVASGVVRGDAEPEELATTLHRGDILDRRSHGAKEEASHRLDGGDEEVVGSSGKEALAYVHGRSKRQDVKACMFL